MISAQARALHDPARRAVLRQNFGIVPRRALLTLARLGFFPSSRAFCRALAGLFVRSSVHPRRASRLYR